jgi:ABC-type phosphate transport system substrate-binding protein
MKFAVVSSLLAALASTPNTSASEVLQIHGSGTTNPSKCYWNVMDMFEEQTKLPVRMTYRAVGSSTGIQEFIGADVTFAPDNDFGSGDIPISTADFTALQDAGVEMVHLPVLLGAISFFHSVDTGNQLLKLDACVLAKIFKRDITDWTDQEIKDQNPDLDLQGPKPIRVARRVQGSSSTASITKFLRTACPGSWDADMVGSKITWPADTEECEGSGGMTDCILEQEGTIGYIDSGHGHSEGLTEIELKNKDGNYLNSKEAAILGGIISALIDAGIPDSLDSNFGEVDLLYRVRIYHLSSSCFCSVLGKLFSFQLAPFSFFFTIACTCFWFLNFTGRSQHLADCCLDVRLRSQELGPYCRTSGTDLAQGLPQGPLQ